MNRLQICQRVRSLTDLSGTGPVSTIGQTGQMSQIVEWVDMGYEDVQNAYKRWYFLRREFQFATVANVSIYTPAAIGIDVGEWVDDSFTAAIGASESWMEQLGWEDFRSATIGASRTTTGTLPTSITVRPDLSLQIWPIPVDASVTIRGEYYLNPRTMIADTDVPIFLAKYHMVVVYAALMHYAAQAAAGDVYTDAFNNYKRLLSKMAQEYLPMHSVGPSLA